MPKMNNYIEMLNICILKQNIKKLMKENGTKQKDLADLLMLTQSDISKRLSDNTTACFTLEQTYKIAHYYNVTVDYLIDGPYIHEQRDITLAMRGSRNQRILNMRELRHGT